MTFSAEPDRPLRLVASARALANETGSAAFTVAQLATRAGLSLKAFYSCFRSKDDLLLALLAEDSRVGADLLAARIGTRTGPDALRAYVFELFDMLTPATGYAGVLVRERRRLTESHDAVVAVDDHRLDPAPGFEGRPPAALQERAPRVVTLDDGRETWVYEDNFYPQVGLNAVAGRPKAEWSMEPARFDEMRRGCYDIEARVRDMDLDGIYASLCFPSLIAGFAGTIFANSKDQELGLACLRAWNDWHIEEWAAPHPDRIIPLQLAWLRDPEIAAADVRRNAERGFKAVSFPENPVDLGLPSVHTDHWDALLPPCA